ncbi:MAG: cyclase family protein [Planctomycetes bacterium]|nr:cyclase family protein [Planctomycetota bacterium]
MSTLYDITPRITEKLGVWPGDTPMTREMLCDIAKGDTVTLSSLHATVHLGAHADGPNHYGKDSATIDERDLDFYLGPCQVIHVEVERGSRVGIDQLPKGDIQAGRVLIGTGTFPDPENWNDDFAAIDPALVDHLHEQGVMLIGIDTPSVDLIDSKDLQSHSRFLANDMAILEGLVLKDVPEGVYELIALPLRLVGFDASPVRAVLREI